MDATELLRRLVDSTDKLPARIAEVLSRGSHAVPPPGGGGGGRPPRREERPYEPGQKTGAHDEPGAVKLGGMDWHIAHPKPGTADLYGATQNLLGAASPFLPAPFRAMAGWASDRMGKLRHLADTATAWGNTYRDANRPPPPPPPPPPIPKPPPPLPPPKDELTGSVHDLERKLTGESAPPPPPPVPTPKSPALPLVDELGRRLTETPVPPPPTATPDPKLPTGGSPTGAVPTAAPAPAVPPVPPPIPRPTVTPPAPLPEPTEPASGTKPLPARSGEEEAEARDMGTGESSTRGSESDRKLGEVVELLRSLLEAMVNMADKVDRDEGKSKGNKTAPKAEIEKGGKGDKGGGKGGDDNMAASMILKAALGAGS